MPSQPKGNCSALQKKTAARKYRELHTRFLFLLQTLQTRPLLKHPGFARVLSARRGTVHPPPAKVLLLDSPFAVLQARESATPDLCQAAKRPRIRAAAHRWKFPSASAQRFVAPL